MRKIPTWLDGGYVEDLETGCWLWQGTIFSTGYAQVRLPGRKSPVQGHRLVYESMVGPIPHGYHVDHVHERGCRHLRCVNPSHLEAVTPGENTRRYHHSLTTCRNGHLRQDLYIDPSGRRRCRECRRQAHARWVAANPERFHESVRQSRSRARAAAKGTPDA